MNATRTNDPDNLDPDQARGYNWQNGVLVSVPPFDRKPWWIGSGGLVSSVADMANWDAALRTGRLLTETELQQMWTPARLNSGEVTDYGFGWIIRTFRGRRLVFQAVTHPGFAAYIGRFIDDKVGVILMANLGDMNSYRLAEEMIALYLPE